MDHEFVCRVCMSRSTKCVSIFTAPNFWGKAISLCKMIMACSPVKITKDDGMPSKICDKCLKLLQLSFLFRLRVLQSEQKFKQFFRNNIVPRLQPVKEGFIEPLVPNMDFLENTDQLYSIEQIWKSAENEMDPLYFDPVDSTLLEEFRIKQEIKLECQQNDTIVPVEEVLLSVNNSTNNSVLISNVQTTENTENVVDNSNNSVSMLNNQTTEDIQEKITENVFFMNNNSIVNSITNVTTIKQENEMPNMIVLNTNNNLSSSSNDNNQDKINYLQNLLSSNAIVLLKVSNENNLINNTDIETQMIQNSSIPPLIINNQLPTNNSSVWPILNETKQNTVESADNTQENNIFSQNDEQIQSSINLKNTTDNQLTTNFDIPTYSIVKPVKRTYSKLLTNETTSEEETTQNTIQNNDNIDLISDDETEEVIDLSQESEEISTSDAINKQISETSKSPNIVKKRRSFWNQLFENLNDMEANKSNTDTNIPNKMEMDCIIIDD